MLLKKVFLVFFPTNIDKKIKISDLEALKINSTFFRNIQGLLNVLSYCTNAQLSS